MNFLNNIFGGKKIDTFKEQDSKSHINWLPLTSIDQIEEIKALSKTESILIFKHSTRCGISRIVIKQFEGLFTEEYQHLKVYYLDLLNYRNVSNEVANFFQVTHESPQLLVIKNTISSYQTSHNEVALVNLSRFI